MEKRTNVRGNHRILLASLTPYTRKNPDYEEVIRSNQITKTVKLTVRLNEGGALSGLLRLDRAFLDILRIRQKKMQSVFMNFSSVHFNYAVYAAQLLSHC